MLGAEAKGGGGFGKLIASSGAAINSTCYKFKYSTYLT